jgi:DNA helicase-2/ATP-dependent DNA helicase PcrA
VMDTEKNESQEAVSIMTMHSAKGLEFDTVFLPGWEEGVLPNQRALDDQGRAGLEEERRLAHVGLTRARRRAKIYFTSNRRIHGSWSSSIPSRFLDELPEAHVEVTEAKGGFGNFGQNYGASRFDTMESFGSNYTTPGWQRAQARKARSSSGFEEDHDDYASDETIADDAPPAARSRKPATKRRLPLTIEGELVAKSTGTVSPFGLGDRVFHQKFGNGNVTHVDGNKLTIAFDKAGEKRVVDSFVERV